MKQVDRAIVPDMPDRIIVATALQLGLALITRDGQMSGITSLNVVW